jgi:hypothetical protein
MPLAPQWRETGVFLIPGLQRYLKKIETSTKAILEEHYATAKASADSAGVQDWYKRTTAGITAMHGQQSRGMADLHGFFAVGM